MNIERFLNHIYYSYTSVERFFSLSSDGSNDTNLADTLMSFCWGGYMTGVIFLFIFLPAHLLGIVFPKMIWGIMLVLPIVISLSFFLSRFFPPPIYNRYYKEFVSGEEDFVTWHIIAYLLLIGAALIFTASVILIDKWN